MVSEDRWGPPGSSLTPLGTLRGSAWVAEGAQRPPSIFIEKLYVFDSFEHPDDPRSKRICVNAPEPLHHVYIGNSFKLLCHVDFRRAIKMGHLAPQGSLPGPPPGPLDPPQAPCPGISFPYVPECSGPGHPRYI